MLDFDECWAAIEKRDGAAAGRFFYGVMTTGVYCRPGCSSRLPLRRKYGFFRNSGRCRGGRSTAVQTLPPCRPLAGFAAPCGGRKGLCIVARERDDPEPRRAGQCGSAQPLPFSSRVQADHWLDTARFCAHAPATGFRSAARGRRKGYPGDLRLGLRVELARL